VAIRVLRPGLVVALAVLLVLVAGRAVDADSTPADALAATAPTTTTTTTPTTTAVSTPPPKAPGISASVGALFAGGSHFCSASVVHSAAGDVVLTAAHCVNGGAGAGFRTGLAFAPGYHDGVAPYGMWTVTGAFVADGWSASADQDLDFAFQTVHQAGTTATVESLTGANVLGIARGFTNRITLAGYPNASDSPVVCQGDTSQFTAYQQRVACAGFPDGTSGGPWVIDADPSTGRGTVVGVIGGYQLGGDTPDVSYSAYFDDDVAKLYASVTG
jgi:V8-like Glu-specific endopeptidase